MEDPLSIIAFVLSMLAGVVFVGVIHLGRIAINTRETASELRKIGEELRKHNQREDRLHR